MESVGGPGTGPRFPSPISLISRFPLNFLSSGFPNTAEASPLQLIRQLLTLNDDVMVFLAVRTVVIVAEFLAYMGAVNICFFLAHRRSVYLASDRKGTISAESHAKRHQGQTARDFYHWLSPAPTQAVGISSCWAVYHALFNKDRVRRVAGLRRHGRPSTVKSSGPSTSLRVNEWRVTRKRESRSPTPICAIFCKWPLTGLSATGFGMTHTRKSKRTTVEDYKVRAESQQTAIAILHYELPLVPVLTSYRNNAIICRA